LKVGISAADTLNRKIRLLGRGGVMGRSVVDTINHLDRICGLMPR
jgi:hypothetical protein